LPLNVFRLGIVLVALLLAGPTASLAQDKGGGGDEPVPFRLKGDVISIDVPGQGMLLGLADRNVAVHGLGPLWYWDMAGWDRPVIGDTVIARGYIIPFRDRPTHVAVRISWRHQEVMLRREDNGRPVWHDQGIYRPLPPIKEQP
jgi:hypothetical protein